MMKRKHKSDQKVQHRNTVSLFCPPVSTNKFIFSIVLLSWFFTDFFNNQIWGILIKYWLDLTLKKNLTINNITCCVKTVGDVYVKWDVAHLRHGADGVNLANERAVGLEEEEKLKMQLVEPLTKLQLLEDIKEESGSDSSGGGNTWTQQHIHKYIPSVKGKQTHCNS